MAADVGSDPDREKNGDPADAPAAVPDSMADGGGGKCTLSVAVAGSCVGLSDGRAWNGMDTCTMVAPGRTAGGRYSYGGPGACGDAPAHGNLFSTVYAAGGSGLSAQSSL